MRLDDWLSPRLSDVPPELATRIRAAFGPSLVEDVVGDGDGVAERCLRAASAMLRRLLAGDEAGRAQAIDLLTADALVTMAFEVASDEPDRLSGRTDLALRELAALAAPSEP